MAASEAVHPAEVLVEALLNESEDVWRGAVAGADEQTRRQAIELLDEEICRVKRARNALVDG